MFFYSENYNTESNNSFNYTVNIEISQSGKELQSNLLQLYNSNISKRRLVKNNGGVTNHKVDNFSIFESVGFQRDTVKFCVDTKSDNVKGFEIGCFKSWISKVLAVVEISMMAVVVNVMVNAILTVSPVNILGTALAIFCAIMNYQIAINVFGGLYYGYKTGNWAGAGMIMNPFTGLAYNPGADSRWGFNKDEGFSLGRFSLAKFCRSIVGHRVTGMFGNEDGLSLFQGLHSGDFKSVFEYGYEREKKASGSDGGMDWYNYRDAYTYI